MRRTTKPIKRVCTSYHPEWEEIKAYAAIQGISTSAFIYRMFEDFKQREPNMATLAEKISAQSSKNNHKKSGRNPEFIPEADKLAQILLQTRKISMNNFTVGIGSKIIARLSKKFPDNDDPHIRINKVLDWLKDHWQDEFVPEVCSFTEFGNKFFKIESKMNNGHNGHEINGHKINGHACSYRMIIRERTHPSLFRYYLELVDRFIKVLVDSDDKSEIAKCVLDLCDGLKGNKLDKLDDYILWLEDPAQNWIGDRSVRLLSMKSKIFDKFHHKHYNKLHGEDLVTEESL